MFQPSGRSRSSSTPVITSGHRGASTQDDTRRQDVRIPELIGDSPPMRRLRSVALRVAPTDATVLLSGPSGTGKEVLAQFIHAHSGRAHRPFVGVNCAAIPDGLVEAELFGHEKGAFTGATAARVGCFEAAEGGTLLLDEITEVGTHVQAKLLRAIQEREIRRVGSTTPRKFNVRIIAASSRDLRQALEKGMLREDLYYRLRMIELNLPPLRERKEDLDALCTHLLARCRERFTSSVRCVSAEAMAMLEAYDWPGNVRELENVLARGSVLAADETIRPADLPPEVQGHLEITGDVLEEGALALQPAILRVKRHFVGEALRAARGNKREAARLLGISRRGLYNLLEEIAAKPPGTRAGGGTSA
ncbi:MAG TPA: sigma 54-interacting transcriptional regulator [Longimicrobium sp.]|jgi:transcriptional regulator with PAS, ATPase and Fis domain